MSKAVVALAVLAMAGPAFAQQSDVTVQGAGATFPAPIYGQWADAYRKLTGTKVNYNSIGSGGGIAQIRAGTVDFGASDAPLKADELKDAGLIQFPMVIGGVVPVVNLEGVRPGQLKLSGEVLASIFLGKVTKWNDPAIVKMNPDVKLPDRPIAVVTRADSSGTTWIFSTYLASVSKEFEEKVGGDKAAKFPGAKMSAKGNEGVASYVNRFAGTIGYVEYAYALENRMTHARMQNKAGQFVEPTIESFQAAAANADWKGTPGFYVVLTNQPGDQSWPITGASYILVHERMKDPKVAEAMLKFFDWAFDHGDEMAVKLHYVPMPDGVVDLVQQKWSNELTAAGQSIWPAQKHAAQAN